MLLITKHETITQKYRFFTFFSAQLHKKLVNTLLIFLLSHNVHSKGHKICEF